MLANLVALMALLAGCSVAENSRSSVALPWMMSNPAPEDSKAAAVSVLSLPDEGNPGRFQEDEAPPTDSLETLKPDVSFGHTQPPEETDPSTETPWSGSANPESRASRERSEPVFVGTPATSFPSKWARAESASADMDKAKEALGAGDAQGAVELYERVNKVWPTAESYNNLGVALERSGQYAKAKASYQKAGALTQDVKQPIRQNLTRTRIRGAVQRCLPYAAWVCVALAVALVLTWLARCAASVYRRLRHRMRFRRVRLVEMSHRVQCRSGEYQPDGRIYPDGEIIAVRADLGLPARTDIYPLHIELRMVRPDGSVWRTLQESLQQGQAGPVTVWFQVDDLGEVLQSPGAWKAQIVLRNIERTLGTTELTVITRAGLIADLEAIGTRLIAVCGEQTGPDTVIFPDVEAVVPRAVIRPRECHPSKYEGESLQVRLDLANLDKQDEVESQAFPLHLSKGKMEFCEVSRPIAGDPIARKVGRWEFRLRVEDRVLARFPFVITTREQALQSIKVKAFDVAARTPSGQVRQVGRVAYTQRVHSLYPVVTLSTRFPSRRLGHQMTMAVCVDGQPVGGVEGHLVMDQTSQELIPGEFVPPSLDEDSEDMPLTFVLLVEGRTLGVREITLRRGPPRCADAQGRISAVPRSEDLDYESEANRILSEACRSR